MQTDYIYSENSRRPITFLGLALSLIMIFVGYAYDAPWYFLAPVAIGTAMCAVMIINNRQSGMELSGKTLRLYSGKWAETIAVSDIDEMQATRWNDSAPSAALHLKSGKKTSIPGYSVGSVKALEHALAARGIATHWN